MNAKIYAQYAALPLPVQNYLRAIAAEDGELFQSSFAADAVVLDVSREIRGGAAILEWAEREIFAVHVSLETLQVIERGSETIVIVKVDGAFDRTGLPDPLVMDHCFIVTGDKIAALTCRLAENPPA